MDCNNCYVTIITDSLVLYDGLFASLKAYAWIKLADNGLALPCPSPCVSGTIGDSGALHPSKLHDLPDPFEHVVVLDGGVGWDSALAWTRYWRDATPPAPVVVIELPHNIN